VQDIRYPTRKTSDVKWFRQSILFILQSSSKRMGGNRTSPHYTRGNKRKRRSQSSTSSKASKASTRRKKRGKNGKPLFVDVWHYILSLTVSKKDAENVDEGHNVGGERGTRQTRKSRQQRVVPRTEMDEDNSDNDSSTLVEQEKNTGTPRRSPRKNRKTRTPPAGMEGDNSDDSRTELEDLNAKKGLVGEKEDLEEDEDMDSDEEYLEREDENLQGMKDVIVGGEAETASAVTFNRYYSEAHARRLLKADVVDNERMLMTYVVHVVFKDMKFTLGDEEEEMALCQMGIGEKYITIKDPKIHESAFVSEYYSLISKNVTHLRTRAISAARKKFIRKYCLSLFLG
jgi:hypothetical protein